MGKTSVLIVGGATGSTGLSIADALLSEPDKFHVIASTRPSSLQRPSVASLASRGAEIRSIDLAAATPEGLDAFLKGAEIVVSTIAWNELALQYPLIDAAKRAGTVKRFIPSDWSPVCVKGVRKMHDEKLAIHEYIIKTGLGYTFIDAGYWFAFPPTTAQPLTKPSACNLPFMRFGSGDVKFATIYLADVGRFVARILQDEIRTLNKYVFIYAEEVTQNFVYELARRTSSSAGKSIPDLLDVSEEEVKGLLRASDPDGFDFAIWDYVLSIWLRGDNTMENARREEYGSALDARELYPDVKVKKLEEYAKEFYDVV